MQTPHFFSSICLQGIDPSIVIILSNESVNESESVFDHLVN